MLCNTGMDCNKMHCSEIVLVYFQFFAPIVPKSCNSLIYALCLNWTSTKKRGYFWFFFSHNLSFSAGKICVICFARKCTSVPLCVLRSKFMRNRQTIIQKKLRLVVTWIVFFQHVTQYSTFSSLFFAFTRSTCTR